jgi:hypothetical protein
MAKKEIKRKGYMKGTTGHKGLKGMSKSKKWAVIDGKRQLIKMTKKEAAESRAKSFAYKERAFLEWEKAPKPKFSKGFKKSAKKQAVKTLAKGVAKTALRVVGPVAAVLTAAEIAKGAVKVGKSMKAKSACQKKGGVYKKGFCITSKSIKARKKK